MIEINILSKEYVPPSKIGGGGGESVYCRWLPPGHFPFLTSAAMATGNVSPAVQNMAAGDTKLNSLHVRDSSRTAGPHRKEGGRGRESEMYFIVMRHNRSLPLNRFVILSDSTHHTYNFVHLLIPVTLASDHT